MKLSLKEQQLKLREEAILEAVNALLAEKGYDAMTVDEVAAYIGIAKTSLYKHFESKEAILDEVLTDLVDSMVNDFARIAGAGNDVVSGGNGHDVIEGGDPRCRASTRPAIQLLRSALEAHPGRAEQAVVAGESH